MKLYYKILWPFSIILLFLTGCMYPDEKLVQNQTAYLDQIQSVQSAISQFQKEQGGILPIKNFEENTPIDQKYKIDFKRLAPKYIAEPPSNAYESGGVFQYVIVDAENDPKVKLFDLRIADTIRELNLRIKTQGYPPYKEKIAENVYTLDYKKLGYQTEPYVESPFSNNNLSFVITGDAEIYVDYRSDLYELLQKGEYEVEPGQDIRDLLWQNSLFVPAYSLPYTIDKGLNEPVFFNTK